MAIIVTRSVLTGLAVKDAMRRQIIRLSQSAPIDHSINYLIKHKVNALMTVDDAGRPAGVVSKTDIMGAYYAGLPIESPLSDIMISPPLFCGMNDSLETALEKMRNQGVYRLYVQENGSGEVVGALAYPDVVGILYRYCHTCDRSLHHRSRSTIENETVVRLKVRDVMTDKVMSLEENDTLMQVMEKLSMYRFGALLIENAEKNAAGVVSKTDLILAYKHQISSDSPADRIMTSPVRACDEKDYLEDAIQVMIFAEVQRIFVQRDDPDNIVGVLSLSDAARSRSGSCKACVTSRIKVEND
jgi:signal-transduction protein with cAMP-binding, CBS, and nucleotidyltransferase domain